MHQSVLNAIASGGSALVDQSTHIPKGDGSSPAAVGTGRENTEQIVLNLSIENE